LHICLAWFFNLRSCCNLQLQLENMVSLHVRSRMFNTLDDAASFIRGISIMYEVYADIRRTKAAAAATASQAAAAAATPGHTAAAAAAMPQNGAAAAGAGAGAVGIKKDEAVKVCEALLGRASALLGMGSDALSALAWRGLRWGLPCKNSQLCSFSCTQGRSSHGYPQYPDIPPA
jgi:hypothetical protein